MYFRLSGIAVLACGLSATLGCSSTLETFTCDSNADCASESQLGGVCESTQVCSFADPSCGETGQRYGNLAGGDSNECVDGNGTRADASEASPADATILAPDANPAEPDGAPVVNFPDAGDNSCVNLSLTVIDNFEANDKVRIRYAGSVVSECQPPPVAEGSDTTIECVYCMPLTGDEIELKGESGIHVESLITDCDNSCEENDSDCKFTPTVPCSALFVFDTDFTTLPSTP